jgi:hypothetical protein
MIESKSLKNLCKLSAAAPAVTNKLAEDANA